MSEPENYAEAVAWFNECKKRRVRDKARIAELEAELTELTQVASDYSDRAEAALAERDKVIDAMEDYIDSCTYHMRDGDTVNYTGPRAEEGSE